MYHCLCFGYWKNPGFCWNGAFESCFLSAGKFSVFRCILYVEELWLLLLLWWSDNFNFCSVHCFSEPHLATQTDWFWNSTEFQDLLLEWPGRSSVLAIISCPLSLLCLLLFLFLPLLKLCDLEEEYKLSPPKVCLFPFHIIFMLCPSALCICAPKSALCHGRELRKNLWDDTILGRSVTSGKTKFTNSVFPLP